MRKPGRIFGGQGLSGAKTAVLLLAAVLALCSCPLYGFCETSGGQPPAAEAQKPAEVKTSTMEGAVTLIEPDGTLVLLGADRKTSFIYIRKETVMTRDGKPAKLSDVKVGDKVVAKYAGMNVALEVTITGVSEKK